MSGSDLRETFLSYFEERGHHRLPSSPLVLPNDPTLLFANAGMNQFKEIFRGAEAPPQPRATTVQKCVRAGGKHNDISEVGRTPRHHTFFEMLGNFSFGDYFKDGAVDYAWDLLTVRLGLPVERLWFTVFDDDDYAAEAWVRVGAAPDRVLRFGASENFWEMGETGPCGPCSEIHYFLGDDLATNTADQVNGEGEVLEVWNLVFIEFERLASGELEPLPAPGIDTGMGLERMAAVLEGVTSNYDTSLIRPVVDRVAELTGHEYEADTEEGFAMRVLADHSRATAFLVADGVYPGNEGRSYVLRKIMRRALWQARRLGDDVPFDAVTDFVTDFMGGAWPELVEARPVISRVVRAEQELFATSMSAGMRRFEEVLERTSGDTIAGEDAFALYDTYGLQRDLIEDIAEQSDKAVDWAGFEAALEGQRTRARGRGGEGASEAAAGAHAALAERVGKTEFVGYDTCSLEGAEVLALLGSDGAEGEKLATGETGEVVLDRTPFFAESGGQVGDRGTLSVGEDALLDVEDTRAPVPGLVVHRVRVIGGEVHVGDRVAARVDEARRDATRANHTATHLLHAALREVLGTHVRQAGSLVAPDRLRFDFTHFEPMTAEELAGIERLVNERVVENVPVQTNVMSVEEAMESGAMALFGEKYGDRVRVVSVDDFSRELCGGTHVRATGDIGPFKVVSTDTVASGVRRVEAHTRLAALEDLQSTERLLDDVARALNVPREQAPERIARLVSESQATARELEQLRLRLASGGGAESEQAADVEPVDGIKVLTREVEGLKAGARRNLADNLLQQLGEGVVVLGQVEGERAALLVRVSDDLTGRLDARAVVGELARIIEGGGGGHAHLAEAGGKAADRTPEALAATADVVRHVLQGETP